MYLTNDNGWVEVICGSMFSGKSEELIRRVRRAKYGNLSTVVFKPVIDDRYKDDAVVTHNGSTIIAIPIESPEEIHNHIDKDIDVVGIDEAQFFDEHLIDVVDKLAKDGLRVIVAGLDTNFRGEPLDRKSTRLNSSHVA